MPTVEGLEFHYALHELPPGRVGFRRWRWELWHGAALKAAGWRLTQRDAERALGKHAARVGRGLFGLRPATTQLGDDLPRLRPGAIVRLELGGISCTLVPRQLADQRAPLLAG